MNKIVVIGDSHASLYSHIATRNRGVWQDKSLENLFDVRWLGPYTLWRLCRDQEKFINFNEHVRHNEGWPVTTKCNAQQHIMLVFGEIDMRCHVVNFKPVENKIDQMVELLGIFMKKFNSNFKLHFQSIVPTIYLENFGNKKPLFPFVGNDEERRHATLYANKKIKQMCQDNNIGYFDIFDLYADEHDMMSLEKSDQIVHAMKTPELEIRIQEYFNDK